MKRILQLALGVLLCVGTAVNARADVVQVDLLEDLTDGELWDKVKELDLLNIGKMPVWIPFPRPPIQWYVPDNPERDPRPYVYFYISEAAALESNIRYVSLAPPTSVAPKSKHAAYASTYQWVRAVVNGSCQWIYMQGYYTPC
jgi:hypothetical protein